jgi:3-hydroxymyristoyl/3-hydroxydecanoyl-(acyl carrier protein) dehydratase
VKYISKEVARCMTGFTESDGILTTHFVFSEDFIGFQGHFPSRKLLPGVCQLQCVTASLEKMKSKKLIVEEIVLAKFFLPVFPLEELNCVCRDVSIIKDNGDVFIVKMTISKGDLKAAEIKLRARFVGKEE